MHNEFVKYCLRVLQHGRWNRVVVGCTEVSFASFLSGGFTTMAVINPPEWKLAKGISVGWSFPPAPDFGRCINPISIRGRGRLCPLNNYSPPPGPSQLSYLPYGPVYLEAILSQLKLLEMWNVSSRLLDNSLEKSCLRFPPIST